ncbi:hypothetical protein R0K19_21915, partial [Bacillus sp. SIMBA_161]
YLHAKLQMVYATLIVIGAILGSFWSINGVAWGVVGAIFINYLLITTICMRIIGFKKKNFHSVIVKIIILFLISQFALLLLDENSPTTNYSFLKVSLQFLLFTPFYYYS